MLGDIAVTVGAEVVSDELGRKLEETEVSMLGRANRVVATKDRTIIVGGKGKKQDIAARADQLRAQLKNTDSKYDREKLEERIAKLTGGVAVIRVGAATETEMKYLKDKIEDAVNATKAAIEEGIVPGGGVALLAVSNKLRKAKKAAADDEQGVGYRIVADALAAPFDQIVANAGRFDAAVLKRDLSKKGSTYGFNAAEDAEEPVYIDMFDAGIIDPVKVTRTGVENATSAAAVLLTTESAVADEPEEEKHGHGAPEMGGMM
jgi:chaperonin GroEL